MTASIKNTAPPANKRLRIQYGGYSTKGVKTENQDAFAVLEASMGDYETKGSIVTVADGVSSASHGKQAAQLTVTMATDEYLATPDSWSTSKSLHKVLTSLNNWLCGQNQQWLTTCSGVIFKSATATLFHVGDSRIYRYCKQLKKVAKSQKKLEQLTQDHISPIGLEQSVLTRALGADYQLKVDCQQVALQQGDIYLLSTDGFHQFVSETEISHHLDELADKPTQIELEKCSEKLIHLAEKNNSDDNLTCLLVYVEQCATKSLAEIQQQLLEKRIPPALSVEQKIDDFKVVKILHASPRSHLYLVQNVLDKSLNVLKAPSANFIEDSIYLQGFIHEAWVGERLNHSHVMKVYEQATPSAFLYHIGEYIEGQTLSQWHLDNPSPALAQVRDIIAQVIAGLRAFQRLDLVHRDLKPDNIMINQQGQIKLIDYGSVAIPSLEENCNYLISEVPVGASAYLAPESRYQLLSDNRSDLFSLAVTTYELLSGKLPYKALESQHNGNLEKGQTLHSKLWQYRSIRLTRPDIPLWLDLALEKATAINPDERYQSYSEFWTDLNKPNKTQLIQYQEQPLINRDPVKFWQLCSLILLLCLIASLSL